MKSLNYMTWDRFKTIAPDLVCEEAYDKCMKVWRYDHKRLEWYSYVDMTFLNKESDKLHYYPEITYPRLVGYIHSNINSKCIEHVYI